MNDDQLDDLKQFITTTVSQATSDLATKEDLNELRTELGDKIDEVNLKLDTVMSTTGERLGDIETRLTNLETA